MKNFKILLIIVTVFVLISAPLFSMAKMDLRGYIEQRDKLLAKVDVPLTNGKSVIYIYQETDTCVLSVDIDGDKKYYKSYMEPPSSIEVKPGKHTISIGKESLVLHTKPNTRYFISVAIFNSLLSEKNVVILIQKTSKKDMIAHIKYILPLSCSNYIGSMRTMVQV
jgi:hypothetical protein